MSMHVQWYSDCVQSCLYFLRKGFLSIYHSKKNIVVVILFLQSELKAQKLSNEYCYNVIIWSVQWFLRRNFNQWEHNIVAGSHVEFLISTKNSNFVKYFLNKKGPSWSLSYGSWIYNYLCNQCLSPLTLWVQTQLMVRCTRYNISVIVVRDLMQVGGFLRALRFPPPIKLTTTI